MCTSSHSKKTYDAGIIFGGGSERFAHFSAKYLIEIGSMGEISHSKMCKQMILLKFLAKNSFFQSVLAE